MPTFHISQTEVGGLFQVDEGHDNIEDSSCCGLHVTLHLQTLSTQQDHTEVSESQVGLPFFGLKTIIVPMATIKMRL